MKTRDLIFLSFMGVLIICAFLYACLMTWNSYTSPKASRPSLKLQKQQVKNWRQLTLDGQHTGPLKAPVQMIEFFDYQCPYCKKVQPAVKAVMAKYSKKISLIYENFPLGMHPNAFGAAIAAECARKMGVFSTYHNLLFENQSRLGKPLYDSLANVTHISDKTTFS